MSLQFIERTKISFTVPSPMAITQSVPRDETKKKKIIIMEIGSRMKIFVLMHAKIIVNFFAVIGFGDRIIICDIRFHDDPTIQTAKRLKFQT